MRYINLHLHYITLHVLTFLSQSPYHTKITVRISSARDECLTVYAKLYIVILLSFDQFLFF